MDLPYVNKIVHGEKQSHLQKVFCFGTDIDIVDYVNGIGNSARCLRCTVQHGRALRVVHVASTLATWSSSSIKRETRRELWTKGTRPATFVTYG